MQDEAQKHYIDLVNSLLKKESQTSTSTQNTEGQKYETVAVSNAGGVYSITLNRPQKKNALNVQVNIVVILMYLYCDLFAKTLILAAFSLSKDALIHSCR